MSNFGLAAFAGSSFLFASDLGAPGWKNSISLWCDYSLGSDVDW